MDEESAPASGVCMAPTAEMGGREIASHESSGDFHYISNLNLAEFHHNTNKSVRTDLYIIFLKHSLYTNYPTWWESTDAHLNTDK